MLTLCRSPKSAKLLDSQRPSHAWHTGTFSAAESATCSLSQGHSPVLSSARPRWSGERLVAGVRSMHCVVLKHGLHSSDISDPYMALQCWLYRNVVYSRIPSNVSNTLQWNYPKQLGTSALLFRIGYLYKLEQQTFKQRLKRKKYCWALGERPALFSS